MLMQAKTLPYQALYAVAVHSVASGLDGYGGTQPWMRQVIRHGQHGDKTITRLRLALFEHPLVLSGCQQTMATGVARCTSAQGSVVQTARRARPFARRALITRRPFLVRIRARKPWVRLRFRLLG